jgi:hydroxyacylglutathione hydrolase
MINIIPIKALKDNYIWCLYHQETRECVVVDPGDAAPVQKTLRDLNLFLTGILITHHHWDHTSGVDALLKSFDVPVYGSAQSSVSTLSHRLREGDAIRLLNTLQLRVIEIPGHTLDHIAYVGNDMLFSGDTLFSAGCGRLFEGTALQMYSSLQKLRALPPETKVYCGHEYTLANLHFAKVVEKNNSWITQRIREVEMLMQEGKPSLPSTIEVERKTNPFLRSGEVEVIAAVEQYAKCKLNDPVDVFRCTREWKDHFKG